MEPAEFLTKHLTESEVRDGAIIAVAPMPAETAAWNSPTTSDGKLGGVATLMLTLRTVRDNYAVDADRVFLLGRGDGVAAALSLAARFPHRFAGVIGMAGDAGETPHVNFKNLPTYFQGAGGQATAFEQKIQQAGYANCTLKADATVTDIWAWMQAHPRVAVPKEIALSPVTPQASKAYWIELPATDAAGGVHVTAAADRASNTITITGKGVRSVKVFLSDALVDLSKPVKIVLNGVERQEVIARSVDEMLLLMFRGTSDAGMVFVAQRDFDLPS
jgi:pimeloyl-ACP methyl ester carboxylesterase